MSESSADATSEQFTMAAQAGLTLPQFSLARPMPVMPKYVNTCRDDLVEAVCVMNWDICEWVINWSFPDKKNDAVGIIPSNYRTILKVKVPAKTSMVFHLVDENFILSFPEKEIATNNTLLMASAKGFSLSSIKNATVIVRENDQGNFALSVTPQDQSGQFLLKNHVGGPLMFDLRVLYRRPPSETVKFGQASPSGRSTRSGTPYGVPVRVQAHAIEHGIIQDHACKIFKYRNKFRWFVETPENDSGILQPAPNTDVQWQVSGEASLGETVVITRPVVSGRRIEAHNFPTSGLEIMNSENLNLIV